jgi:hypothetical protein
MWRSINIIVIIALLLFFFNLFAFAVMGCALQNPCIYGEINVILIVNFVSHKQFFFNLMFFKELF